MAGQSHQEAASGERAAASSHRRVCSSALEGLEPAASSPRACSGLQANAWRCRWSHPSLPAPTSRRLPSPVRSGRIIVSRGKSGWLGMHEPQELPRSRSSCSGSQKASQLSSACQQLNGSSPCLGLPSPQAAERPALPLRRARHGFFLPLASDSPHFLLFPLSILSFPETVGLCSQDLSRSYTLWLCFLGLNLVAHLVGPGSRLCLSACLVVPL
jgi:hypothetical protein